MRFQANFFDRFQNDCRQFNHQKGQDDRVSCINKADPVLATSFSDYFRKDSCRSLLALLHGISLLSFGNLLGRESFNPAFLGDLIHGSLFIQCC